MALVKQLGNNSWWYVSLAAVRHWYLLLSIYIKFVFIKNCFVHSFKKISGVDGLDGMVTILKGQTFPV